MDAQKILFSFLDGRTIVKVDVVMGQTNTDEDVFDRVVLLLDSGIKITFSGVMENHNKFCGVSAEIEKCSEFYS